LQQKGRLSIHDCKKWRDYQKLRGYLSDRSLRKEGGPWTMDSITFATKALGKVTVAQRVSFLKLFLGRFDRDRRAAEGQLGECDCKKGMAHLGCWIRDCRCPEVVTVRQRVDREIRTLLRADRGLMERVSSLLIGEGVDIRIWRGNWLKEVFGDLLITGAASKLLGKALAKVVEGALQMHSIVGAREKRAEGKPAMAVGASRRLNAGQVKAKAGALSRTLFEFGFKVTKIRKTEGPSKWESWKKDFT
jgi:hypothetical protein